jgi:hypothetical protein
VPVLEDDPYPLQLQWFLELLEDNTKFKKKDTEKFDLTMAEFQALVGAVKLLHMKNASTSEINEAIMEYLLD